MLTPHTRPAPFALPRFAPRFRPRVPARPSSSAPPLSLAPNVRRTCPPALRPAELSLAPAPKSLASSIYALLIDSYPVKLDRYYGTLFPVQVANPRLSLTCRRFPPDISRLHDRTNHLSLPHCRGQFQNALPPIPLSFDRG